MKIMDTVYGFAGHSIVPALALIHSKIADRYVLMFTEELEDNRKMFEQYLEQKQWDGKAPEILLPSIGSVGDFSREFSTNQRDCDVGRKKYGLFLQNGAKQLIMALLLQHPNAPDLLAGAAYSTNVRSSRIRSETIVALSPEEVIDARGVNSEDALLEDTTLDLIARKSPVYKTVDTLTEFAVSTFVHFISKFGRNGAVYRLVYNHATGRILNTIPPNVECIKEEEE